MSTPYRHSSHSIFSIHLHLVWITKYRYRVLTGDVGVRTKELIRRICVEEGADILSGSISPDHVHLLLSINPSISVSTLMRYVKGKTSRKLQMEFPSLRKRYWGQHLWARGYFAVSTGNVTDEMIKRYIEHHFEGEGTEDSFRVEEP